MTDFDKGDVVKEKAGGPRMTIDRVESDGSLHCLWFIGSSLNSGTFDPELLEQAA